MEIRYSKIVARESREAVIELYGDIGDRINGDYLASEINYLDKNYDVIRFRINSMGGSFVQGLSVISAITGAKAKTIAVIEGIAGSMAAFIAISCDKVEINDFARLMFHSPYYRDENGDRIKSLSDNEQKAIASLRGIVVDLLTRRGKSREDVIKILDTDTWYTASEALDAGYVDSIIDTGVAAAAAGLSIDKLVAFARDNFLFTNTDTMKNIAAKLGLPDSADEQAIVAAIDQKDTSLATARTKLVDSVIAAGKKSGTITDLNEAQMRRLAVADLDLFIDLVVAKTPAADNTRLSEIIAKLNESGSGSGSKNAEKDWDWYQKNDPVALKDMRKSDPEQYNKLYKAYWG